MQDVKSNGIERIEMSFQPFFEKEIYTQYVSLQLK